MVPIDATRLTPFALCHSNWFRYFPLFPTFGGHGTLLTKETNVINIYTVSCVVFLISLTVVKENVFISPRGHALVGT